MARRERLGEKAASETLAATAGTSTQRGDEAALRRALAREPQRSNPVLLQLARLCAREPAVEALDCEATLQTLLSLVGRPVSILFSGTGRLDRDDADERQGPSTITAWE